MPDSNNQNPNDRGENAIGLGERTGFAPNFPEARPVSEIEQPTINVVADTTNEYEALVPAPDSNEYVALANQAKNDQKTALQQSFFVAKNDDPDKKAKVINIANRLNLPPAFVEKNIDSLEPKTPAANDYDAIIQKTPGLAKFLQNPDNAALSKDDLENLGKVDQANGFWNQAKSLPKELGRAWAQGTFQSASSIWSLAPLAAAYGLIDSDTLSKAADNVASENKMEADLAAKAPAYLTEFNKLREQHGDQGEAWKQFVSSYPEFKNGQILQALKDFGSGGIKTVGNALSLISDLAENPRATAYQLAEMTPFGFAMTPGALAGGAIGTPLAPFTGGASIPIGSAIGAFANSAPMLTGGKINDLLKASGVDVTNADSLRAAYQNSDLMSEVLGKAQRSGLTMAAVQALFMPLAGRYLGEAEAAGSSKIVGAAKDVGIQSAGLSASDIAAQAAENKGNLSKIDPMQSLANGVLGLAHSVGSEAIGHSFRSELHPNTAEAAKDVADRTQEAMHSVQNAQALQEMSQGLQDSKVGDRVPEKISELVDASGHDNKVYFQTDDWDQYWKTKGISPVEAAQKVLGDAAPYLEAKNTGANLEIPMADLASSLGKTEHFENLIPSTRSEPDGLNLKEANETLKNLPATMNELAEEAKLSPAEQSASEVKANVKQQLIEAGTRPADAEKQSSLYEAAFKSLGERTGQDPKALFDQYQLKIGRPKSGESAPILGPEEHVLNQGDVINFAPYLSAKKLAKEFQEQKNGPIAKVKGIEEQSPKEILGALKARFKGAYTQKNNQAKLIKAIDSAQQESKGPYVTDKISPFEWLPNYAAKPTGEIGPRHISEPNAKGLESDPLKWADSKYGATKKLIEEHAKAGIPLTINTSSDLVGRGDYIDRLPDGTTVNMYMLPKNSIKGETFEFNRELFPGSPSRLRQEAAIEQLRENGIHVNQIEPTVQSILEAVGGEKEAAKRLGIEPSEVKAALKKSISASLLQPFTNERTLFQGGEESPRGQIRIGKNSFNIDLLKNADMSTFLHETGHFYLELLRDIGSSDQATPEIQKDLVIIHDWLGVKEGNAPTVEQHEQFARGFEAYLMEGKAPSSALKKAFESFKIWLTNIYRSVKNLDVDLTPQVRQVFDRLLASEDEIKSTEVKQNMDPLFSDPIKAGMSKSQADRYIKARDDAREASVNELSNKLLEDVRKRATSAFKEKEATTREKITEQIDDTNLYKAINQLQGKEVRLDLPDFKLSKDEILKQYGKEFVKKLPKGIWAKPGEGISADVAAELLNFHSGDDMLTQFANAPDRKYAIEAQVQSKMQEENPDLLTSDALSNAAMEAVHNDKQATFLRMELEHLASNNMPALKDVIRKVARRVPTEKSVRDEAERIIGNKNIEDAKPYLFERAERKAAKDAGELLAKGDIDGAFQAKQKELLNHELWKAANDAQEDIEKSLKRFRKLSQSDEDLSKTRDTDLVNAARSLLSMHGIGNFGEDTPDSFLKKMKSYDEEGYYTVKNLLDTLTENPKPYDQMTYSEFSQLKDTVDALWSLSRSQRQMEFDGKKIDRDEVIQKLSNRFAEVDGPQERAQYEKAKTGWDKTKMVLLGIKAALTRVEHWAAALDKGSIEGPFQTHLVRPIMDAISEYRLQKDEYLKNVQEILSPLKEDLSRKAPIRSDELGYEFSGKAELLGALLHTGNESNFDKLLRGNGWEKDKWDSFINRMIKDKKLGKTDYDTIQKIWDVFEKIKPEAQKAHKEMYGFHFNEITAKEFSNEFGDYRGGYAPAIADPLRSPDANIRNEKELLEKFNNSWMFPTTGRGFTKGRVQEYAAPLMMDLRLIASHIDKVLKFVNIEPRVKDAAKVVMNREFRRVLDAHDPAVGGDLLVPWLQRAAQQRMNTPSQGWAGKGSDIFFRELRTRAGLNSLVGNLGHILHVATTGLPTGLVLVDPAKMRDSLWSYLKAPKDTVQAITEKSDFMKSRMSHQTSQIMESIDEIILNPTKLQKAQALATKYGYYIQQSIMNQSDSVIWNAAYNQAIEKGLSEKSAIAESDSVIRRTQHASNPEDVSKFETGTPFIRFFTQFVSYFNMRANLLQSEGTRIYRDFGLKKGAGAFLGLYFFGHMVPALLHEAITRAIAGKFKKDDDDSDLSTFMSFFFGSQFREAASLAPVVGPVAVSAVNQVTREKKGFSAPITTAPSVSMINTAVNTPGDFISLLRDGTHGKAAIHDSLTLLGLLTGLPTAPLSRPIGYLNDVSEGKAEPSGPIDFARGLLTGKPGK